MEDILFSDWEKLDIRVGEIIEIEDIPGADKLLKLIIDLGTETRTIVAGLKQYYLKDELEGKKCIVLCNLAPRNLRGIESKGMIIAAVNDDHSKVSLIYPDSDIELGSKIS